MNPSRRRVQEEIRMVERQLPLYYQKVNELEKRHQELQAIIHEENRTPSMDARNFNKNSLVNPINDRSGSKQDAKHQETLGFDLPPQIKSLSAKAKTNVVRLLGDTRGKFHVLNEGLSQAVVYLDTMIMVLNLMEQSGGGLHQQLMATANSIQQQVNNPSSRTTEVNNSYENAMDQTENNGTIPFEAIMEIIKSPHFQQLADQLKSAGIGS
jgi:hypothetical protein